MRDLPVIEFEQLNAPHRQLFKPHLDCGSHHMTITAKQKGQEQLPDGLLSET